MLIVIEGIDGSGKSVQAELLRDNLKERGFSATMLDFPDYESFSGAMIGDYLNGRYGPPLEVDPRFCALMYGLNRFEQADTLHRALDNYDAVILNRYTHSTYSYHSCKLPVEQRATFLKWLEELEFDVFGLPRPDLTVLVSITPEKSLELLARKGDRDYVEGDAGTLDAHEKEERIRRGSFEAYREMLAASEKWRVVDSLDQAGEIRPPREIARDVLEKALPLFGDGL